MLTVPKMKAGQTLLRPTALLVVCSVPRECSSATPGRTTMERAARLASHFLVEQQGQVRPAPPHTDMGRRVQQSKAGPTAGSCEMPDVGPLVAQAGAAGATLPPLHPVCRLPHQSCKPIRPLHPGVATMWQCLEQLEASASPSACCSSCERRRRAGGWLLPPLTPPTPIFLRI